MKYNIYGKIIMFTLAIVLKLEYIPFAIFIALGHILDTHYLLIWGYLTKKQRYQTMSENLILLLAYFNNYLNLDVNKSYQAIRSNCIIEKNEEETVKKVLKYYSEEFLVKKSGSHVDKLIKESLETISLNPNDGETFFRLVEAMFDIQDKVNNAYKLELLQAVANIFNINYHRSIDPLEYSHETASPNYKTKINNEFKSHYAQSKNENINESINSNTNSTNANSKPKSNYNYQQKDSKPKDLTPKEVKDAFKVLGLTHKPLPDMIIVKKVYKEYVKQYHPDMLKSKNISDSEIKKMEEKMLQINVAMGIVKKYLAKV